MAQELHIIRACEFIQLGVSGKIDLEASRESLRQLAGACRKRGLNQALLDLRELQPGPTPMLTPTELATLVNTFREAGFSEQQRLAVLYSADPHGGARLFAFIGTMRGWNVMASDSYEELVLWLSQGQNQPEKEQAGAQEIPVQIKKPAPDRARRIQVSEKSVRKDEPE